MKIQSYKWLLAGILAGTSMTVTVNAQNTYAREEAYYLAGRVPEEDGRVVFSEEIVVPGKNRAAVYEEVLTWMTSRLEADDTPKSRIVYTNPEKGEVVGMGDEWLVFHSKAFSLDRARMSYQLTAFCQDGKFELRIEKIRYTYEEVNHYLAEEWITDEVALNKTQTKVYRGYAKWRKKTVDFADNLFKDAREAMGLKLLSEHQERVQTETVSGTLQPLADTSALPVSVFRPQEGTLVVSIGSEPFNMTTMTVDHGGRVEQNEGNSLVVLDFGRTEPVEALQNAGTFAVKFYPSGSQEPSVVLQCRISGEQKPEAGSVVCEILNAQYRK